MALNAYLKEWWDAFYSGKVEVTEEECSCCGHIEYNYKIKKSPPPDERDDLDDWPDDELSSN